MKGDYYPSWRYHRTEAARIVQNAADDAALGDAWVCSPREFAAQDAAPVAAEPVPDEAPKKRGRPKKIR
jgi:hypothetical protein